jgi:hypothetical protein
VSTLKLDSGKILNCTSDPALIQLCESVCAEGPRQIQVATQQQSDAITPVRSVPESIASILDERKDRTRLGLSKYAAEAAKRAAESDGNLVLSRNVCDVAAVGSSLWPEDQARETILNLGELGYVSAIDSYGRTIWMQMLIAATVTASLCGRMKN